MGIPEECLETPCTVVEVVAAVAGFEIVAVELAGLGILFAEIA